MKTLAAITISVLWATTALAFGENSGAGVGVTVPQGDLADINDTSYYLQWRTLSAEKVFGWRGGVYYADTIAHGAVDGGRAFGFDAEAAARFGGQQTFGYVFAGAGYGRTTFSQPSGGVIVRDSQWDWSLQGGVGIEIKRMVYVEAMFVQFQTDPKISFIPVVVGFHF